MARVNPNSDLGRLFDFSNTGQRLRYCYRGWGLCPLIPPELSPVGGIPRMLKANVLVKAAQTALVSDAQTCGLAYFVVLPRLPLSSLE